MELNIVMFDESKAKFVEIVSKYKSLDRDIESVADYHIVSTARKELARYRIDFEKNCKAIRDEATKFNRSVRDKELEALAEVEPVEEALKSREQKFKLKKEMENRRELLPSRISKLETIGITMSDDDILRMDDKQFDGFFLERKTLYLAEKERVMKEQMEKIEADRKRIEQEEIQKKAIEEAKLQAQKQAEEKARREAEEAQKKHEADIKRIEKEKADFIALQEKKKEDEEKEKKQAEEKAKKDKEELEKKKKYIYFRESFGYTEENKNDFIEKNTGEKVELYKKVGEFIF